MNTSKNLKVKKMISLLLGSCFVLSPVIAGDNYAIKSYVTSSGGGSSNGGNYLVHGTIGQPVTAQVSGGSYTVQSGYWHAQQGLTDVIFKNSFE